MSYIVHNNIVVTCNDYAADKFSKVHKAAIESFGSLVSPIIKTELNGYLSFFIATDGSKEGWPEAALAEKKRIAFCDYIDTFAYEDGSTPIDYVDIAYGENPSGGHQAYIARANVQQQKQFVKLHTKG